MKTKTREKRDFSVQSMKLRAIEVIVDEYLHKHAQKLSANGYGAIKCIAAVLHSAER